MNRYLLVIILVLGIAAGAVFFLVSSPVTDLPSTGLTDSGSPEATNPERSGGDSAAPQEVGSLESKRQVFDDSVAGGAGEPAAYRRALSGLRGRLVWAGSGEPISGVEVKLGEAWLDAIVPKVEDIAGMAEIRAPVVFRASARSDSDGVFLLQGAHSRALLFLAIGLQTDTAGFRVVDRAPGPGELLDLGDILLLERGTVTGRVLDDDGKPVHGARVRVADIPKIAFQFGAEQIDPEGMVLWVQGPYRVVVQFPKWLRKYDEMVPFGNAYTEKDGSFKVTGVRPGSPTMIITKQDLAPIQRTVVVESLQQTDLGNLSMGEGEVIQGKFVDSDGKPVTTVSVAAGGGNSVVPVAFIKKPRQVDSKGGFEISGLPRNQLFLVYQRKPGQPWEVSGPHRADDDVKIVLGALAEGLVTIVEGPNKNPYLGKVEFSICVADESAFVPGLERMLPGRGHFFRDAEKKHQWAVRELPQKTYRVIARAESFGLASAILDLGRKSKDRTTELHLIAAPSLRFEVVDQAGKPVEAARVYWNPSRRREDRKRSDMARMPIIVGKTDAEGVLEVTTIPTGSTNFYARHPAFALAHQDEIPTNRVIRLVLGSTGSLEGIVAEDGQPPTEEHTVVAQPIGETRRKFSGVLVPSFATPGPGGTFRFGSLQPGTWRLRVVPSLSKLSTPSQMHSLARSTRSRGPDREVEVFPDGSSFLQLELRSRSASDGAGSIVGSIHVGGEPAKGAWVQTWAGQRRAEVKNDGSFELSGLNDGDLWISVERAGASGLLPNRLWEGRVKIVKGSQETLLLDVQVGDVEVEVVDAVGKPVSGLALALTGKPVQLTGHQGQARIAVLTDSMGRAVFGAVPHGEYTLRSAMQRDSTVVLPNVKLSVFRDRVDRKVTAISPVRVSGTVRFDESELKEGVEREWARQRRPTYLVFSHERRYIWGPLTEASGVYRFRMRPGPPGDYELLPRGKLRWTSSILRVPVGGGENMEIVLRPDATQVRAVFAKQKSSTGSGDGK